MNRVLTTSVLTTQVGSRWLWITVLTNGKHLLSVSSRMTKTYLNVPRDYRYYNLLTINHMEIKTGKPLYILHSQRTTVRLPLTKNIVRTSCPPNATQLKIRVTFPRKLPFWYFLLVLLSWITSGIRTSSSFGLDDMLATVDQIPFCRPKWRASTLRSRPTQLNRLLG